MNMFIKQSDQLSWPLCPFYADQPGVCVPDKCVGKACPEIGDLYNGAVTGVRLINLFFLL